MSERKARVRLDSLLHGDRFVLRLKLSVLSGHMGFRTVVF